MIDILEIDSLIIQYDNNIIFNSVYLRLERGKAIGLFGRNGSGKSSLMQFIIGDLKPYQGHLRYNNNYLPTNKLFDLITFLPQYSFLPEHYTINKVMQDYALEIGSLLKYFTVFENRLKDKIKTFSSGEKRLIEFYIVLFSKSKFCILDEPFSSIMPKHIDKMVEIINFQSKTKGILICDHQNEFVHQCTEESYRIENKQIIFNKSETK